MSAHKSYPRCKRCDLRLPGQVQHDTEAECISALQGRLTIKESALAESRYKYQRRRDSASVRIEWLEGQLEIVNGKLKELEDACSRALARSDFAVRQVSGARTDLRRSA